MLPAQISKMLSEIRTSPDAREASASASVFVGDGAEMARVPRLRTFVTQLPRFLEIQRSEGADRRSRR
jgi:hypothetical protein